jgi:hypothetical protein
MHLLQSPTAHNKDDVARLQILWLVSSFLLTCVQVRPGTAVIWSKAQLRVL